MRIIYIRQQDYWIFPLCVISVLLMSMCLYAGVLALRVSSGAIGVSILLFLRYIIGKNYSKRRANHFLVTMVVTAALLTLGAYLLTN